MKAKNKVVEKNPFAFSSQMVMPRQKNNSVKTKFWGGETNGTGTGTELTINTIPTVGSY